MAATTTFIRLTGKPPNPRDFKRMHQQLNEMARALAMLAPIYVLDPVTGKRSQIDEALIGAGRFAHGGVALETPDGRTYEDLRIERCECEDAIAILSNSAVAWKGRVD